MKKSETIGALAKALSEVQRSLKPVTKTADNPFYKSKYAPLEAHWEVIREPLGKAGLALIQTTRPVPLEAGYDDNGLIVETTLVHTSGEWVTSELYLPLTKQDPQGVASAVTYGRRAGLSALIGTTVIDEDDDGNAHATGQATGQATQRTYQRQEPQRQERQEPARASVGMTDKQSKAIWAIAKAKGVDEKVYIADYFEGRYNKEDLTSELASEIIESLNAIEN